MEKKRANVIWFVTDQQSAHMLSCNGNPDVKTPNIDYLAEYGINFVNAVSTYPLCCPFRGSMLTGLYPNKCIPGHNWRMPEGQETLAHVFNREGYKTAYFGKWHVDGPIVKQPDGSIKYEHRQLCKEAPNDGMKRETYLYKPKEARGGFGTWLGYENNNSPHNTWVHGHTETEEVPLYRLPKFETDSLTDLLIDYVKDASTKEEPFFAVVSVQPPHNPYAADEEYMRRFDMKNVKMRKNVPDVDWIKHRASKDLAGAYAMVENIDYNVGKLRKTLRDLNIDTETYVMFFSDHGDMHGSQGLFHKTNPFYESSGIPFIIGGGLDVQGIRKEVEDESVISAVDIAPTTLGLCGIKAPDWMQGYDYSPIKTSSYKDSLPSDMPTAALLQAPIPTGHGDSTDKAWRGVVTKDGWKYVCFENMEWLLFNMKEDKYEQANLAHNPSFKAKKKELNSLLQELLNKAEDDFSLPKFD